MKYLKPFLLSLLAALTTAGYSQTYPIVDTDVNDFYSNNAIISAPTMGQPFYGQDAHYAGNQPSYTDNGDGTITDQVTGLMWEKDMGNKIAYDSAFTKATASNLGGFTDWRVPTIKELYSLAFFTGRCFGENAVDKFIDTTYFNQPIGNPSIGEREIDAQTWSSTQYTGLIMNEDTAVFGYNFVDGRLKGYPKYNPQTGNPTVMYFRLVRGNPAYGINNFVDNGDGTVTDEATGLMWQQADDEGRRDWSEALQYCENLSLAGHDDWRLPNAKELHSLLDYSRSPDFTNSPAIDPLFACTPFSNPDGDLQYGYYWTSSPLQDGPTPYTDAVYLCFGRAQGQMAFPPTNTPLLYDTHGAGAQRNDPKEVGTGTYPSYFGPQGDILYVNNFTRAVRDAGATNPIDEGAMIQLRAYPNPTEGMLRIEFTESLPQASITVSNILGEVISTYPLENETGATIELTGSSGLYVVEVRASNGKSMTIKAVKR